MVASMGKLFPQTVCPSLVWRLESAFQMSHSSAKSVFLDPSPAINPDSVLRSAAISHGTILCHYVGKGPEPHHFEEACLRLSSCLLAGSPGNAAARGLGFLGAEGWNMIELLFRREIWRRLEMNKEKSRYRGSFDNTSR